MKSSQARTTASHIYRQHIFRFKISCLNLSIWILNDAIKTFTTVTNILLKQIDIFVPSAKWEIKLFFSPSFSQHVLDITLNFHIVKRPTLSRCFVYVYAMGMVCVLCAHFKIITWFPQLETYLNRKEQTDDVWHVKMGFCRSEISSLCFSLIFFHWPSVWWENRWWIPNARREEMLHVTLRWWCSAFTYSTHIAHVFE